MSALLAYAQVDHGNDEDDNEEHKRRSTCKTVVLSDFKVILNMSYDGVHVSTAGDSSGVAEYTDDAGVFLEAADKAGDNGIPSKANYDLNILHNREENNRVYEQVIDHITIWKDDYMLYTCDGLYAVRSKAYKDTWFLTKEEAEEKLKEYKDNGN